MAALVQHTHRRGHSNDCPGHPLEKPQYSAMRLSCGNFRITDNHKKACGWEECDVFVRAHAVGISKFIGGR